MVRRLALLLSVVAWCALACAPVATLRPFDPVGPALAPEAMALAPGIALVDAHRQLRAAGVTNLNNPLDSYIESSDGHGYFALAGDQLDRLLIFVDGKLRQQAPIARTRHPYVHGVRVHAAGRGSDIAFAVVSRATAFGELASLQLVIPGRSTARYDLTLLALANEGLRDPLFVGRDLGRDDGIAYKTYFTARRSDGQLWPRSYLLDAVAGQLAVELVPVESAVEMQRCSCYQAWRAGDAPPSFEQALAAPMRSPAAFALP